MQEMSQTQAGHQPGAFYYVSTETPRLLETPDGWRLVGYNDRELARLEGVSSNRFEIPVGARGFLAGDRYFFERWYWSQALAILVMQGALLQRLIGPNYLLIGAEPCVPWDPRPHLKNVYLARLTSAPEGMGLEEALVVIRRCS